MKRAVRSWLFLPLLVAAAACAGSEPLAGPITGFVFDAKSQTIRPIQGLPGASLLGTAVTLPFSLRQAEIAPGGRFALAAVQGDDDRVHLVADLDRADTRIHRLDTPMSERITFSANGASAVLWNPQSDRFRVISGMPERPELKTPFSIPGLPGSMTAVAVTDDGTALLVSVSDGERKGGLYRVSTDGGETPQADFLLSLEQGVAITFLNGDREAIAADAGSARVFHIRDLAGAREVLLLAGAGDGVDKPAAISQTVDGRRILVVNTGSRNILMIDLSGGEAMRTISVPLGPTRCDRMLSASVFRLNDGTQGPLYLLDLEDGSGVSFFVPAQ
jgi:hypothetical protein